MQVVSLSTACSVDVQGVSLPTALVRYRTETSDAGMPNPAASSSIPMPSNVRYISYVKAGSDYGSIIPSATTLFYRRLLG